MAVITYYLVSYCSRRATHNTLFHPHIRVDRQSSYASRATFVVNSSSGMVRHAVNSKEHCVRCVHYWGVHCFVPYALLCFYCTVHMTFDTGFEVVFGCSEKDTSNQISIAYITGKLDELLIIAFLVSKCTQKWPDIQKWSFRENFEDAK